MCGRYVFSRCVLFLLSWLIIWKLVGISGVLRLVILRWLIVYIVFLVVKVSLNESIVWCVNVSSVLVSSSLGRVLVSM